MIPRTVHTIWVGDPMPAHLADVVESWRRLHPGWGHIHWDEDLLRANLTVTLDLFERAEEITPHVGQFRSDVARYELLWRCGGVYVDCDLEARRPIDPLIDEVAEAGAAVFAAWETDDVWVNNAILGAAPGTRFMRRLMAGLGQSIDDHPRSRPNVMTGPQYLTPVYREHVDDVHVFPAQFFYPYLWNELERGSEDFPDAYAVHHWENMRRRKGKPRE